MTALQIVTQIKRVRTLLERAEMLADVRKQRQYTIALFHLHRSLEDLIILEHSEIQQAA